MRAHISASSTESEPVRNEASSLLNQKEQIELKQRILDAFHSHFIVSEDEATSLTSTAEPVNDRFFQVLTRVKKIHNDCQTLLGTENQQIGLEILEQSSKLLNGAFQKLYRWIQREFKGLDLENPQINVSVRRSLRVLAERPTLFQSCLDSFAEAREHNLSESFYTALTGPHSLTETYETAKPIEYYAHDPIRYVGDMLAWAHSAAVSEQEALEVLFISEGDEIARSIQHGLESEPWARGNEDQEVFDGRTALNELVSRDLAGVARLFRQRTEQVIQSHDDVTLTYKLANLIGFYKSTFIKLLGSDSAVIEILRGLEDSAMRQFRSNMRDHVAAVQSELTVAPADLAPPEFLEEALNMLRVLIKDYDSSMAAIENRITGFQPVIFETLDPFLSGCENIQKTLPAPSNDIFAMNCLIQARSIILPYPFTSERVSKMEQAVKAHRSSLVEYQHRYFLSESGLNSLLFSLSELPHTADATSQSEALPIFEVEKLASLSQQLDEFLPSALIDATDNIKKLRNTKLVQEITEEAAAKFCEDFEYVESKILQVDELHTNDTGRPLLRDYFPRTSGEIRVLLS